MTIHDTQPKTHQSATGANELGPGRSSPVGDAFRIGEMFGIEIRITASWALIAVLVAFSLFYEFSIRFPALGTGTAIALGSGFGALFFASIVFHELSHLGAARSRGISVGGITLFLFGGISETTDEPSTPRDEFTVAIAGPVASFAIAALCWFVVTAAAFMPETIAFGLGYLGWVNFVLGVFNLVPGFPLDGGRVLRSIVWRVTGDRSRATRIAANSGRLVGIGLVGLGVFSFFFYGALGGLWLAAIGWFLHRAAGISLRETVVRDLLASVTARDVVARDQMPIPSSTTLAEAVDIYLRHDQTVYPVQHRGEIVGAFSFGAIHSVARHDWEFRQVWWLMTRLEDIMAVPSNLPMGEVLDKMRTASPGPIAVFDGEVFVGLISTGDIARRIQRSLALDWNGTQATSSSNTTASPSWRRF